MDNNHFLIDTHCHLAELTDEELLLQIDNASKAGVRRAICIGASNGTEPNFRSVELANTHDSLFATVGIHPHDAGKYFWDPDLVDLLNNPKVLAVGETGLDFFKEWSDFTEQEKLFEHTIEIANSVNKNTVIHCRDAHNRTLEILKSNALTKSVFHCFGGNREQAKEILDLGNYISLTGIITFKNANALRECISYIPLDRIMLETDAPYMAPEPHRGKKSEPAHVLHIAERLAEIHNVSLEEVTKKTTQNAREFFSIR